MQKGKHKWETYRPLGNGQYYIDKTDALEKGIEVFPSIYIEGAAASGKTTAVRMLFEKHPELETAVFWMEEEVQNPQEFLEKLEEVRCRMEKIPVWAVFENLPKEIPAEMAGKLLWLVRHLPERSRVIITGREKLPSVLLELLWNRQIEILPQNMLCFSREEIREFVEKTESSVDPSEIYEVTGGWPGCVALMLRLSGSDVVSARSNRISGGKIRSDVLTAQELRKSYEVDTYIQQQILDTLSEEEQEVMRRGQACPWMDEKLCREVWGIPQAEDVLESLYRKGLMICNKRIHHWKVAPLFLDNSRKAQLEKNRMFWKHLGSWYGMQGYVRERLWCLEQLDEQEAWKEALKEYYDQVPFLEDSFDSMLKMMDVMEWKENTLEVCYLRGMSCWKRQDLEGLNREIAKLEEVLWTDSENDMEKYRKTAEIYLNLCYVKSDLTLDDWLELVEKCLGNGRGRGKLRLYGVRGKFFSCLDGMRDLTGLFACSKKEEHRKAKIWKAFMGRDEWMLYRLARMEYYEETERGDSVPEEDQNLLKQIADESGTESFAASFQLSVLYLLCRLQRLHPNLEQEQQVARLEEVLLEEESDCRADAEAIGSMYALWRKEPEKLTRWLHYTGNIADAEVTEQNFIIFYCRAKGYMFLSQYEKSGKILQLLIPYLQSRRHNRFLAEILFEQAIVFWNTGHHGKALRSTIESFIVNGNGRYVGFYTEYGARGSEVLVAYIEWLKNNSPKGWHRKKKYNYGNVLRMPEADYMEMILRFAKRETRSVPRMPELSQEERLTMMETIILQNISRGLNNAEICNELNLKLPTVKSHIYSLYKKLGVNSRVQAIIRGKEMGIVE